MVCCPIERLRPMAVTAELHAFPVHPLHRRIIEEKGLYYVWATVKQGPRLYGLQ